MRISCLLACFCLLALLCARRLLRPLAVGAVTALVLVGDFLAPDYERSKLYDPAFTTEFRKGEPV